MSKIPKANKKNLDHRFLSRITKTLYYGKLPKPDGLSLPVTELASELFSEAHRGHSLDRLHCDHAANISRNACLSPCSLVIALLYLERLKKKCPEYVERTTSSDLFLVSLMVSCKFLYDDGESDEVFVDEWALSGATTVKELVQLERDFLKAINWEVFVSGPTFWRKLCEIEKTLAKKQGISRGFFTYTELKTLSSTIELHNLIQNIAAIAMILVASYTVALLTLFGSIFIVSHIPGASLQRHRIDICLQRDTSIVPFVRNFDLNDTEGNIHFSEQTDIKLKHTSAVNVLKTGLFLASIESFLKPFCNKTESAQNENSQSVSWDWWTVPTMSWLSETSAFIERSVEIPKLDFFYWQHFYEVFMQRKFLDLEDQVHRSTKIRIQDQLENSWHMEWTDTLMHGFYNRYFQCLRNIKV